MRPTAVSAEPVVVATVETEEELSTSLKRQIESLIRIHVVDLHEVTFEVNDD